MTDNKPELILVNPTANDHTSNTNPGNTNASSNTDSGNTNASESQMQDQRGTVEEPAKVMRIGTMIKQLLEEVRQAPLDEQSRSHLRQIYQQSVHELSEGLSPDLQEELERLTLPFAEDVVPSEAELRIAQAQLVGWLEGLFHGIQAALFAQQTAARAQLEELRRRGLPPGEPSSSSSSSDEGNPDTRPGTYL